jgi:hypothetical protein
MIGWDEFPAINSRLILDLEELSRADWQSMSIEGFRTLATELGMPIRVGIPLQPPTQELHPMFAGNSCLAMFEEKPDCGTRLLQLGTAPLTSCPIE